ncbi:zinc finger MYM-type protein 2-like [Mytilus edulis]|uniref:zinc finger MYM-type protein 2-like n=1 Tax=Mytilus edulis TaxID=6550 RepID=UPI0039F0A10B
MNQLVGIGTFELKEEVSENDLMLLPTQDLVKYENEPVVCEAAAPRRFSVPLSDSDLQERILKAIPKKTRNNNKWALGVWVAWTLERNLYQETITDGGNAIPSDPNLLSNELLNYWMAHFIQECRRVDTSPYPPNSLVQLASGIQRYLRTDCNRNDVSLFEKDSSTFAFFRKCLDSRMKELTNNGIGTNVKRADPILTTDEEVMWDSGVFNCNTSNGLTNIVFFHNCKLFGFRALNEHKQLDASQFRISVDTIGNKLLHYTGRLCKNVQGGLNNRNVDVKRITQKSDPTNPRYLVTIYEKYLSLIPREGRFYRKPLPHKANDGSIRFSVQPIGINTLSSKMKELFKAAGISTTDRNITNHSGKVTCCTTLFNAGFSDSTVKSRSGHRSTAVDTYKRPLETLQDNVSKALQPPVPTSKNVKQENDLSIAKSNQHSFEDKENDNSTMTINVPNCINKVVIFKNGKRYCLEI